MPVAYHRTTSTIAKTKLEPQPYADDSTRPCVQQTSSNRGLRHKSTSIKHLQRIVQRFTLQSDRSESLIAIDKQNMGRWVKTSLKRMTTK